MDISNLLFSYVSIAKFSFIMVHLLKMVVCLKYVRVLTTGNQDKEVV
jgi:hypothetical protein